jgi:hypothetical protein
MSTSRLRLTLSTALLVIPGAIVTAIALIAAPPAITPRSPFLDTGAKRWYKGNTHTHTVNSDGDSTPDEVVRWYREQRYQFLVLTDHNFLTSVDGLNALHGAAEKFLVIRGEEVTDKFEKKELHLNALDLQQLVMPQGGASVAEALQRDVDAIRKADGIPHINHPNFRWSISADDLKQVRRNTLFEIFNGHPQVNGLGGDGVPGLEEVWDQILSSGQEIYGLAVDDAHTFKRPWDLTAARPGQGWVYVRSASLQPRAIVAALDRGEFYSSTGVELDQIVATAKGLTVTVKPNGDAKYRVQFVGKNGRLLKDVAANPSSNLAAAYDFTGDEGYVRARVIDSNGKLAWVQPVFLSAPAVSSK